MPQVSGGHRWRRLSDPRRGRVVGRGRVGDRRRQRAGPRGGRRAARRSRWWATSTASAPPGGCGRTPTAWRSTSIRPTRTSPTPRWRSPRRWRRARHRPQLVVIGGVGDRRLDHLLGTLLALGPLVAGRARVTCAPCIGEHTVRGAAPRPPQRARRWTLGRRSRCWRCTAPCTGVTVTVRRGTDRRRRSVPPRHAASATKRRRRPMVTVASRRPDGGRPMNRTSLRGGRRGGVDRRSSCRLVSCGDDDGRRPHAGGAHAGGLRLVPHQGHAAERRTRRVHRRHRHRGDIVTAGDAGTMVTKAVLTAGNPEGDVMWGVDNTLLSAATDGEVFEGEPTQVDFGDVCVNYDIAWFATTAASTRRRRSTTSPMPAVQGPAGGREPGHVVARPGVPAGHDRRGTARTGGSSTGPTCAPTAWRSSTRGTAPTTSGSAAPQAAPGDQPLVVSYASSPPAEVDVRRPARSTTRPPACRPTPASARSSTPACCAAPSTPTRQRNSSSSSPAERVPAGAAADPVRVPGEPDVAAARGVHRVRGRAHDPFTVDPDGSPRNREQWQDQWTEIVLR